MPLTTDPAWEEKILSLKGENDRIGYVRLQAQLEQDFANGKWPQGIGDPPSTATVRRILVRRWDGMTDEDRTMYRRFHWPQSMERGALPWDASAAALELLGLRHLWAHGRPSIRLVRWYWRVAQAAPGLPPFTGTEPDMPGHFQIAAHLAAWESVKDVPQHHRDAVEMYLAYRSWRSLHDYSYYIDALGSGLVYEIPPFDLGIFDIEAWDDVYGQNSAKIMSDMEKVLKTPEEGSNGNSQGRTPKQQ